MLLAPSVCYRLSGMDGGLKRGGLGLMNLYIGNLSRMVTEADLETIFEGLGHIVFARLAPLTEGREARGYAFVAVADEGQARVAVSAMNGKYLKGLRLIVRPVLDHARQARALRAHQAVGSREAGARLRLLKGGPQPLD